MSLTSERLDLSALGWLGWHVQMQKLAGPTSWVWSTQALAYPFLLFLSLVFF